MTRLHPRFAGRAVFITGGGGGIAGTAAGLFAAEGARVFVTDRDHELGAATVEAVRADGGEATFQPCDVTDPDAVRDALAACRATYGGVDVLFNCAGGTLAGEGPLTEEEPDFDLWRRSLDLNLLHVMYACHYGLEHLRESAEGAIVNMASIAAVIGNSGAAAYSAAKGGVVSLTRSVAALGAPLGVRANAVAPGLIRTERILDLVEQRTGSRDGLLPHVADMHRSHPHVVGDPVDIANIVLFLASDESRMLTGEVLHAYGGVRNY